MSRGRHDFGEIFVLVFLAFAVVSVLAIGGYGIWREIRHPCIETEKVHETCGGGMYCCFMDQNGACLMYTTYPTYDCVVDRCVRRKP